MATPDGAILFASTIVPRIASTWFDPAHWQAEGKLRGRGGGRAAACFIDTPVGPCVLRHYHRGGMVASLSDDSYFWTGAEHTRGFREFRLLERLHVEGLPVPEPVGARYARDGLFYRADLITRQIPGVVTLSERLLEGAFDETLLRHCGELIARFHRRGVYHADLNATNILVAADDALYLIDFDRGCFRKPQRSWQQANMKRLHRSLIKMGLASDGEATFNERIWFPLRGGHAQVMESGQ